MTKIKDGDKFILNKCKHNKAVQAQFDENKIEFTIGKIYEARNSGGDLVFTDDRGYSRPVESWLVANGMPKDTRFKITKIVD